MKRAAVAIVVLCTWGLSSIPVRSERQTGRRGEDVLEVILRGFIEAQQERERAGQGPIREITNVAGDLYRFRSDGHYGTFLVTPEGIILVDPISTDTARWLKAEIDERFGLPVRYVIYSHFHYDHIEGGPVFADTANFVAHEGTLEAIRRGVAQTLPGGTFDHNGNAVIEFDEAVTGMKVAFSRLDRNGDGRLTGAEMFAEIQPPDTLYSETTTITLGGRSVRLIHPGFNHSYDATVVLFPEQRAVFAVDFVGGRQLLMEPFFDRTPLAAWIDSLEAVEALEFDIFVPGHGEVGTKSDVVAARRYLEELATSVAAGIAAGRSLEELEQSQMLSPYRDWANYDLLREAHIAWAYDNLIAYPFTDQPDE